MSQPWGYEHRREKSVRGLIARWWYRRRSRVIARELAKRKRG
jgi:hypothetical protein